MPRITLSPPDPNESPIPPESPSPKAVSRPSLGGLLRLLAYPFRFLYHMLGGSFPPRGAVMPLDQLSPLFDQAELKAIRSLIESLDSDESKKLVLNILKNNPQNGKRLLKMAGKIPNTSLFAALTTKDPKAQQCVEHSRILLDEKASPSQKAKAYQALVKAQIPQFQLRTLSSIAQSKYLANNLLTTFIAPEVLVDYDKRHALKCAEVVTLADYAMNHKMSQEDKQRLLRILLNETGEVRAHLEKCILWCLNLQTDQGFTQPLSDPLALELAFLQEDLYTAIIGGVEKGEMPFIRHLQVEILKRHALPNSQTLEEAVARFLRQVYRANKLPSGLAERSTPQAKTLTLERGISYQLADCNQPAIHISEPTGENVLLTLSLPAWAKQDGAHLLLFLQGFQRPDYTNATNIQSFKQTMEDLAIKDLDPSSIYEQIHHWAEEAIKRFQAAIQEVQHPKLLPQATTESEVIFQATQSMGRLYLDPADQELYLTPIAPAAHLKQYARIDPDQLQHAKEQCSQKERWKVQLWTPLGPKGLTKIAGETQIQRHEEGPEGLKTYFWKVTTRSGGVTQVDYFQVKREGSEQPSEREWAVAKNALAESLFLKRHYLFTQQKLLNIT